MAKLEFSAPLNWPQWIPVTPLAYRKNDRNFAPPMEMEESIRFLQQELDGLGCDAVLSTDIDQPLNERMTRKLGSRPGAVMELHYMDSRYVVACDQWLLLAHNIYALHLALRQWRSMERWGIAPLPVLLGGFVVRAQQEQSSTGKPSASASVEKWMEEMGLGPTATLDDLEAVYHRRARRIADDTDALVRLNITMETARAYFKARS
ncbi:MAG: hypothetical protein AB7F82_05775 [Alphaproteobacteria bacterium]